MPTSANLAAITSFDQLLPYLEEHLEWPIERYTFEDLTFAFEPEELGLKDADAAKIKAINQLRPLRASQPFGIFFVEFEHKKLPVVVLRRILSHLALKKRTSANKTATPAWRAQDILFVSAYGEDGTAQREIAFAHFHQTEGDLPTLRVLGWDGADTPLKLAHVDSQLRQCLKWPADEADAAQWRAKWSAAFKHRSGYVIRTANELAQTLALFARQIRDAAVTILAAESERGAFHKLYKGFQTALIHDLTEEAFADTYAQTITYGLLTAAISRTDKAGEEGTALIADNIADMVPVTNPFLKDMLETFLRAGGRKGGINFDELGIQDVVDLLRDREKTDLAAVLRDFNNKTQGEDPVIHFYEHFLSAYNKKLKIQRGVFYTPQPVVSYIVRSVHELLQTEFGLEDGLASTVTWGEMLKRNPDLKLPDLSDDPTHPKPLPESEPFVQILDPATGTATFLVETIDVIHKHLEAKWRSGGLAAMPPLPTDTANCHCKLFTDFWNLYVPQSLLPRLHGYELLMAPYAIAHMKLGLKLHETGYHFATEERARIYLTNALEPKVKHHPHVAIEALAHEAKAVNEIKWYKRFTVVIGNPPYAGHSSNTGDWISVLIADYYKVDGAPLGERNPKWLQDDYVKFIRLGQHIVTQTGYGLQSFITNHGYLDNPTFRGLRQNLIATFSSIDLLDLHGNTTKKEVCPDGSEDVNVFDIKQGVAIFAARRYPARQEGSCTIQHASIFGTRIKKYTQLVATTFSGVGLTTVKPSSPFYLFVPQDSGLETEYARFEKMTVAMPVNVLGFQTHRDHFAVDLDRDMLLGRITEFRESRMTDAKASEKFSITDNRDWNIRDARRQIRADRNWRSSLIHCTYRPFDVRSCYFSTVAMDYPRRELLDHVAGKRNLCLGLGRQGIAVQDPVWSLIAVSRHPVDANIFRRGGINIFPLYLYPEPDGLAFHSERRPNLSDSFLDRVAKALSLSQKQMSEVPQRLAPEDIFHYIYGVLHSLSYRARYAEFLKIDFPRMPLTSSLDLFRALAKLGGELVALHLLESPKLDKHMTKWVGDKKQEVEKVTYSDGTVLIDKAKTTGFKGVPEDVWAFHIGGYQVCEKWLKDRKGRTLSDEDITHYHKIVVALSETIRLMSEIDTVIAAHGGWPGAFATK